MESGKQITEQRVLMLVARCKLQSSCQFKKPLSYSQLEFSKGDRWEVHALKGFPAYHHETNCISHFQTNQIDSDLDSDNFKSTAQPSPMPTLMPTSTPTATFTIIVTITSTASFPFNNRIDRHQLQEVCLKCFLGTPLSGKNDPNSTHIRVRIKLAKFSTLSFTNS